MDRPSIIDLNPVELGNYSFMISLDKCTGSCNVLSQQICVSKETNDINFKAFTMLINKNKAKKWQSIFPVTINANSIVQNVIQTKNGIIKHVNMNVKIIVHAKKIIVGILVHVFLRIAFI